MAIQYTVTLTGAERYPLHPLMNSGASPARQLTQARLLLKADAAAGGPHWSDHALSEALDVALATIHRTRQALVEGGVEARPASAQSPGYAVPLSSTARQQRLCWRGRGVPRRRTGSAGPGKGWPTDWGS